MNSESSGLRALDLFCCAGGASRGLQQAGFHVTGVDINPQPSYIGDEFIRDNALSLSISFLRSFDLLWASPPCQRFSSMTSCRPGLRAKYPDLIAPVRNRLQDSGVPWILENVPRSPLRSPVTLCMAMFQRPSYRHRNFESSIPLRVPLHPEHKIPCSRVGHWVPGTYISIAGHLNNLTMARYSMGIPWMRKDDLSEAIPPVFAEYLGLQARSRILSRKEAA